MGRWSGDPGICRRRQDRKAARCCVGSSVFRGASSAKFQSRMLVFRGKGELKLLGKAVNGFLKMPTIGSYRSAECPFAVHNTPTWDMICFMIPWCAGDFCRLSRCGRDRRRRLGGWCSLSFLVQRCARGLLCSATSVFRPSEALPQTVSSKNTMLGEGNPK